MAKPIKIGETYYSDIRVPCDGTSCPTPWNKKVHSHRRRKALSKDKRYAEEKLDNMVKMRSARKYGDPLRGISWDAFKSRYMAYSVTKNPRTHDIDKLAFRKLEEAISLTTLESLTPERLEMFKGILQQSGNTVGTQNRLIRAIKAAINKAVQWDMMNANWAFKNVKCAKEVKGKLHFLTAEEIKQLFASSKGIWKTIAMLGYYTGMRRSEIYYLKTENVDFKRRRIHVAPSEEFTPKDFERRYIPMHPKLEEYLKRNLNGNPYVLGEARRTRQDMTKGFRVTLNNLGIKGTLHTMRHTFASHLAMVGVPIATISKMLGHASIKTTEIYTHLLPEHMDQEIKRLPDL